jgi:hypothetical protein
MVNSINALITDYDKHRLTTIFKLLGTRIIPTYFFSQNPKEMVKWQFNACRQTALLTAYFLKELIKSSPNFNHNSTVRLWDGNFEDKYTPAYNHAWVTLEPDFKSRSHHYAVILDLARMSTPVIVEWETVNENPMSHSEQLRDLNTYLVNRSTMDYDEMLLQNEFYTGKTGIEICKDIEKMMLFYSYDLSKFKWDRLGS